MQIAPIIANGRLVIFTTFSVINRLLPFTVYDLYRINITVSTAWFHHRASNFATAVDKNNPLLDGVLCRQDV